jgi:hypothetical protein
MYTQGTHNISGGFCVFLQITGEIIIFRLSYMAYNLRTGLLGSGDIDMNTDAGARAVENLLPDLEARAAEMDEDDSLAW